jgi:hypothetical protein
MMAYDVNFGLKYLFINSLCHIHDARRGHHFPLPEGEQRAPARKLLARDSDPAERNKLERIAATIAASNSR